MFLGEQPFNPPREGLGLWLGIASILLVVGWTLTRFHRDRMRFALMRAALDKGVTRFPGTPPYWVVSLRQGVTLAALGFGLAAVETGTWWLARGVEMPTAPTNQPAGTTAHGGALPGSDSSQEQQGDQSPPPATRPAGQDRDNRPPRPDGEFRGPRRGDLDRPPVAARPGVRPAGPEGREDDDLPPGARGRDEWNRPRGDNRGQGRPANPNPPPHDPAIERWHEARAQQTVGLVSAGAGFILILLGLVRIAFAKVEQRYVNEADHPSEY